MKKIFILICFISCVVHAEDKSAQDSPFYEKDFAKSPMEGQKGGGGSKEKFKEMFPEAYRTFIPDGIPTIQNKDRTHSENDEKKEEDQSSVDPMGSKKKELFDQMDGTDKEIYKVISVGAVINGVNKKHLEEYVQRFQELIKDRDFPVGKLKIVGPPEHIGKFYQYLEANPTEENLTKLFQGLLNTEMALEVPAELNISSSPTWVIQTDKGTVLLEGYKDPRKFFNKKGELALPKDSPDEIASATPAITPTSEATATPQQNPDPVQSSPAAVTPLPSPTPSPVFQQR